MDWTLKIKFSAESFDALKGIARKILAEVAAAKNFRELPIAGGSSGGLGTGANYSVELSTPIDVRIKALRDEANKLEAELGGPANPSL